MSPTFPTIATIQWAVCARFGVTVLDLVSARRAAVRPRQVAMWLCRQATPHSLPAIGRAFGGRDHTTVGHACRRIEALIAADPDFADTVGGLLGSLRHPVLRLVA